MKNQPYVQLPVTVHWSTPCIVGPANDQNDYDTAYKENDLDWRQLSLSKDPRDRESVSKATLHRASQDFVNMLNAQVEEQLYVVCVDARKAADAFWQMNKKMCATNDPKLQGFFGTRARIVNNVLDATWYKNRFITNKVTGNTRVLSDHVSKGKGYRYPSSSFKTAKKWEIEAIKVVEDHYALLRQKSAVLTKIRRAVAQYESLVDQCRS